MSFPVNNDNNRIAGSSSNSQPRNQSVVSPQELSRIEQLREQTIAAQKRLVGMNRIENRSLTNSFVNQAQNQRAVNNVTVLNEVAHRNIDREQRVPRSNNNIVVYVQPRPNESSGESRLAGQGANRDRRQ